MTKDHMPLIDVLKKCAKMKDLVFNQLGYIEDLEDIDEENLYLHYKSFLETSPIEILYVGHFDEEIINYLKKKQ